MDDVIKYYGEYISEDSIIRTTDGREMKGKYEVSKGILECCLIYNKEQMDDLKKEIIIFGIIGVVIGVAGFGIYKVIKTNKNNTNKNK